MINWREFPFIRILIPFIFGIILAIQIDHSFPFGNVLLGILFIGIIIFTFRQIPFKFRSVFGLFTISFFFLLGYQLTYKNNSLHQSNHFQSQLLEENTFIGTVTNMPIQDDWIKLIVSVSNIKNGTDDINPVIGKILVYAKPDDLSQQLKYGDLISF